MLIVTEAVQKGEKLQFCRRAVSCIPVSLHQPLTKDLFVYTNKTIGCIPCVHPTYLLNEDHPQIKPTKKKLPYPIKELIFLGKKFSHTLYYTVLAE